MKNLISMKSNMALIVILVFNISCVKQKKEEIDKSTQTSINPNKFEYKIESGRRICVEFKNMKIWADRQVTDSSAGHTTLSGRIQILIGKGWLEEAYDDPNSSVTINVLTESIVNRTGKFMTTTLVN